MAILGFDSAQALNHDFSAESITRGESIRRVVMPTWAKCVEDTDIAREDEDTLYINLDRVLYLSGNRQATAIFFGTGEDEHVLVRESPEQILGGHFF